MRKIEIFTEKELRDLLAGQTVGTDEHMFMSEETFKSYSQQYNDQEPSNPPVHAYWIQNKDVRADTVTFVCSNCRAKVVPYGFSQLQSPNHCPKCHTIMTGSDA